MRLPKVPFCSCFSEVQKACYLPLVMRYSILVFLSAWLLSGCVVSSFKHGKLIPAAQTTTGIPMKLSQKLILVEATVNGVSGQFLFDNGFSKSAINADFAHRAGVGFNRSVKVNDANNKRSQTKETYVDSVEIGGHLFVNTGFLEVDIQKLFPCEQIDGVIGASIINKVNWELDFENKRIRISSKPFENEGSTWSVRHAVNNSSVVKLAVKGQEVQCKIDLGSTGDLKLRTEDFKELFLGEEVVVKQGISSISVNGMGDPKMSYNCVDPIPVKHAGTATHPSIDLKLEPKLKHGCLVGMDYFNEYTVTINSSKKEFILTKPQDPVKSPDKIDFGVGIYPIDGVWKIVSINPNDPAIKDLKPMDVVESIDGRTIKQFEDLCALRKYFKKKIDLGEPLQLTIKGKPSPYLLPLKIPLTTSLR